MKKTTLYLIVLLSIFGGCANKTVESNKTVDTLSEFVDKIPGESMSNIAEITLAKAVKKVKNDGDIFVQLNNIKKVEIAFSKWCLTVSMDYNSVYKFPFETLQKDIMSATKLYQNSKVPMNVCYAKNTKSLIAGYVVLKDGIIAFYGPDEANEIRLGNLILEKSEKNNEAILAEKRKAETFRQIDCKASLDENIRKNISIGIQTNYGMVVDIKKPLVQVQKYRDGVPILEWINISFIAAPDMINYCR